MSVPLLGAGLAVDVLPFTPASISGLQLWLDASDASTLFQNSNGTTAATAAGDPVGYWGDRSGNGRNVTQSDGTMKPALTSTYSQNGIKGILGDGSNDYLITSSSGFLSAPFTYFVVLKSLNASRFDRIVDGQNAGGNFDGWTSNNYIIYSGNAVYGWPRTTTTQLVVIKFNGASSFIRINGASSAGPVNPGSTNPSQIGIFSTGISGNGNVVMYEFLAYNNISDANRSTIESYLNTKWSIY